MSSATLAKAVRLHAARLHDTGRVTPRGAAAIYRVEGDHGTYAVVIADDLCFCTCPARVDTCAHVCAALLTHDERVAA